MRRGSQIGLTALAVALTAAGTFAVLVLRSGEPAAPRESGARPDPAPAHRAPALPAAPQAKPAEEEDWLALTPGRSRRVEQEPAAAPTRRRPRRHGLAPATRPDDERVADPKEPADPPEEADTTPPPLRILSPAGPTVIMNPKLLLRVRSEPGARVAVGDLPLAEHSAGLFARDLHLAPGRNALKVIAQDAAGNRAEAQLRVTYVSSEHILNQKSRFNALMEQLDEIQAAAADLDRRIASLIKQLRREADADRVARLSDELRSIRNTRRELRQEIERAIGEIDTMLAPAPASRGGGL